MFNSRFTVAVLPELFAIATPVCIDPTVLLLKSPDASAYRIGATKGKRDLRLPADGLTN